MSDDVLTAQDSLVIGALRRATRSRHAALSASPEMSRLFAPDYNLAEYRTHLGRLLGLFEPLEKAVSRFDFLLDPAYMPQRSTGIRDDLRAMDATEEDIQQLERCRTLPVITPSGILGYSYVILGSLLGGKIIVRHLRGVLGGQASFRFYGFGDGNANEVWERFCSYLEAHGKDDIKEICATAVEIFDAYGAWLSGPRAVKEMR
jgi:heme oxygenase